MPRLRWPPTLETLWPADGKSPILRRAFSRNWKRPKARRISPASMFAPRKRRLSSPKEIEGFKFTKPMHGPEIKKWLRHGIGLHHAAIAFQKYRVLVDATRAKGFAENHLRDRHVGRWN